MHAREDGSATEVALSRPPGWHRTLALGSAAVFLVSAVFPTAAGLSKNLASFPRWWGVVDVSLAFLLGVLAFVLIGISQGKVSKVAEDAAYRGYRFLIHGLLVLMLVFFLTGDRVVWINCLSGFAWRAWLLLYCLPAWFAAWGLHTGVERVPPDPIDKAF